MVDSAFLGSSSACNCVSGLTCVRSTLLLCSHSCRCQTRALRSGCELVLRQYRSSSCCILPAAASSACCFLPAAGFCMLLLASSCCCVLPAAVGFCLLLVSRWEKGCEVLLDLDRTSIEPRSDPACLCRNPVLKLAIPLLAVSATRYLFALPIGSVRLHQASSCLLPTI